MEDLDGEWELVFSTVKHGIFRSSPFFLAVQEAFGDQDFKCKTRKRLLRRSPSSSSSYMSFR